MSLQAIQNRLAVTGQALQNIGHNIATTLKGMVVTAGQAFKQLGGIIAQPFIALHRALSSRHVEQQPPPEPRNGLEHQYRNRSLSESRDSLLAEMSIIETDVEGFENELGDIPPQPRDTLLDSSEHLVVMENISQVPQRAVFSPVSSSFAGHLEKLENHDIKKMVSGSQAIKDSGLVESHVEKFKQVAQETKTILMFRPVNPMSTGLLAEGTSAKGLNVHGKSSDWGPMAGYIAFDQALSKKHNDVKAIIKGNEDNAHSIKSHEEKGIRKESPIQAKQLSLSPSRLDYLKKEGLIKPSNDKGEALENGSTSDKTQFFTNGKGGNDNYLFRLDQSEDGSFKVSYKSLKDPVEGNKIEDWQELKVMGDKATGKPLTADYDMFAMLPKTGEGMLAGKTIQKDPKLALLMDERKQLKEKLSTAQGDNLAKIKDDLKSLSREIIRTKLTHIRNDVIGQKDRRNVDPELGRLTQWQGDIRTKLNESVKSGPKAYTGGDLVKHGTEQDNTQFSEKDEKVFVIMPDGKTFMTQNWEQTQAFMWAAKQDDFLTYTNRSYVSDDKSMSPTQEQTVFYPGQVPQFRKNDQGDVLSSGGTQHLEFDLKKAAVQFGLTDN